LGSARAAHSEKTTLFLDMTSDDAWTAQMGLGYAEQVLAAGYPVVVFLNVRAVRLADRTLPQDPTP
jgi:predicted peroxiredoxin